jgi:anaerobic dimethyl sulfoxide reductase subunit B
MYVEGGTYPDVYAYKVNMSCNHCAEPACLPSCPTGAIFKRLKDGIVDIDSTLCIGCRRCEATYPFGAPQYIPEQNIVSKCNMCDDEIDAGRKPYCVMACMMRVLDIGPIDKLRDGTYETKVRAPSESVVRQVKNMADPELTKPSIVFKSVMLEGTTRAPEPCHPARLSTMTPCSSLAIVAENWSRKCCIASVST